MKPAYILFIEKNNRLLAYEMNWYCNEVYPRMKNENINDLEEEKSVRD